MTQEHECTLTECAPRLDHFYCAHPGGAPICLHQSARLGINDLICAPPALCQERQRRTQRLTSPCPPVVAPDVVGVLRVTCHGDANQFVSRSGPETKPTE